MKETGPESHLSTRKQSQTELKRPPIENKHAHTHKPVMLNWVAFSSCSRWSSSLRPPPKSEEEEKAGGGSAVRGERGLHTVLWERPTTTITQHPPTNVPGFIMAPVELCSLRNELWSCVTALKEPKTNERKPRNVLALVSIRLQPRVGWVFLCQLRAGASVTSNLMWGWRWHRWHHFSFLKDSAWIAGTSRADHQRRPSVSSELDNSHDLQREHLQESCILGSNWQLLEDFSDRSSFLRTAFETLYG